ncbi:L,D-transpeptidase [Litoribacillus peritrichatus]|uniref:L,D-transpeptidase n=1 Tax=Litoribacillus peritrichatus TaxID=718191 RepID=A0ABP7M948_9GAMM
MTLITDHINVSIAQQTLTLVKDGKAIHTYSVSTAKNGAGELNGSGKTPRGRHIIRAKIGGDRPQNAVFIGRRFTGEVYSPELAKTFPNRDWILSRILWLSGTEVGKNRLGHVDSMRRYIYIHGTPDSEPMGEPLSHGCIRMRNEDVMSLFELVPVGCSVDIQE